MRTARIWCVVLVATLAAFAVGCSGSKSKSSHGKGGTSVPPTVVIKTLPKLDTSRLGGVVAEWLAKEKARGAVVGVQVGNETPHFVVAGLADPAHHVPMRENVEFMVGGVTQAFVGQVALQLSEQHRLDLDATIDKWLTSFPNAKRITVRDLMTQRSGLAPLGSEPAAGPYRAAWLRFTKKPHLREFSDTDIVAFARTRPLLSRPGGAPHYSELNGVLLGRVVEKVTGKDLAVALREGVIGPLGMKNTYVAATDHRGAAVFPQAGFADAFGPVGSTVSTPSDLLRWAHGWFRARVRASADLRKSAFEISAGGTGLGVLGVDNDGFCVLRAGGCPPSSSFIAVGAVGKVPGGSVEVMYDPSEDLTVVVLASSDRADVDGLLLHAYYLAEVGAKRYDQTFEATTTTKAGAPTH
jgi:CubicO group peptidase (beta-lactamase class C family)